MTPTFVFAIGIAGSRRWRCARSDDTQPMDLQAANAKPRLFRQEWATM
jgi:hypothetical protein